MQKTMGTFLAVLLLLVAGCAVPHNVWVKQDVSMEQALKEMSACAEKAGLVYLSKTESGDPEVVGALGSRVSDFEPCMKDNGFKKK